MTIWMARSNRIAISWFATDKTQDNTNKPNRKSIRDLSAIFSWRIGNIFFSITCPRFLIAATATAMAFAIAVVGRKMIERERATSGKPETDIDSLEKPYGPWANGRVYILTNWLLILKRLPNVWANKSPYYTATALLIWLSRLEQVWRVLKQLHESIRARKARRWNGNWGPDISHLNSSLNSQLVYKISILIGLVANR